MDSRKVDPKTPGLMYSLGILPRRIRLTAQNLGVFGMVRHYANKAVFDFQDTLFDVWNGVDTGGVIWARNLDVDGPSGQHAYPYQGSALSVFRKIMRSLNIDHQKFTFVDLGSGKGRVLLAASEFPFRRVVGVELSRELTRIAEKNVQQYTSKHRRNWPEWDLVCMDATAYQLPPEPLVLFMANPFERVLMQKLLGNIEASLAQHPRDVWIVYYLPRFNDVFRSSRQFHVMQESNLYWIYRNAS